jgi:pectin-derived oligosaccharide transport system substrate-binding protein
MRTPINGDGVRTVTSHPFSRRTALAGLALLAAAPALAACGGSDGLRLAWWGAEDRHKRTLDMVKLFEQKNPGKTLETTYGGFQGFQDRLSTEIAGGNGPDIMQIPDRLPFLESGALLALDSFVPGIINLDHMAPALIDTSRVDGQLFYLPWGLAAGVYFYDTVVFDQVGAAPPTNEWTWDEYAALARQISDATPPEVYGSADIWAPAGTRSFAPFEVFLRQRRKFPYTEDGRLAFEKSDLTEWFTFWDELRRSGAVTPPEVTALETGFETSPLVTGKAAMYPINSSIASSLQGLAPNELGIVNLPNGAGSSALPGQVFGQYINASVTISGNARTSDPETVARFIDFVLNDPDANKISLMSRGVPPSSAMVELVEPQVSPIEQKMITVIDYIQSHIDGAVIPPPAKSSPITDLMDRCHQDIAFERATIPATVDQFFTEAERELS